MFIAESTIVIAIVCASHSHVNDQDRGGRPTSFPVAKFSWEYRGSAVFAKTSSDCGELHQADKHTTPAPPIGEAGIL
jgi:hypothetical protein